MWGIKSSHPVTRQFRPGEYLFHENDQSRSLFLLRKGSVSVRKSKPGGEVEIARIHSNEVVGEISFFDRLPRSAAAVALTEVEALEITFEALDKIFDKVPPYFKSIIAGMADRLRRADDTIRKLQKDFVQDSSGESASDIFTAADALAAYDPDKKD
ncbi:MAG: Crp/Fnr family transcriptional regulator [Bdellovibrionia bacterium]